MKVDLCRSHALVYMIPCLGMCRGVGYPWARAEFCTASVWLAEVDPASVLRVVFCVEGAVTSTGINISMIDAVNRTFASILSFNRRCNRETIAAVL